MALSADATGCIRILIKLKREDVERQVRVYGERPEYTALLEQLSRVSVEVERGADVPPSAGFAVVPVEPTEEMIAAGKAAICWHQAPDHVAYSFYRAMLRASPHDV